MSPACHGENDVAAHAGQRNASSRRRRWIWRAGFSQRTRSGQWRRHGCESGSGTPNAKASDTISRLPMNTSAEKATATAVARQEEREVLTWQPMPWTVKY